MSFIKDIITNHQKYYVGRLPITLLHNELLGHNKFYY